MDNTIIILVDCELASHHVPRTMCLAPPALAETSRVHDESPTKHPADSLTLPTAYQGTIIVVLRRRCWVLKRSYWWWMVAGRMRLTKQVRARSERIKISMIISAAPRAQLSPSVSQCLLGATADRPASAANSAAGITATAAKATGDVKATVEQSLGCPSDSSFVCSGEGCVEVRTA